MKKKQLPAEVSFKKSKHQKIRIVQKQKINRYYSKKVKIVANKPCFEVQTFLLGEAFGNFHQVSGKNRIYN